MIHHLTLPPVLETGAFGAELKCIFAQDIAENALGQFGVTSKVSVPE